MSSVGAQVHVMLSVSQLRKQFSSVLAVDNVSFQVQSGQIFGLIGPNGAGKTTTIRMILDIIQPDSGSVTIDGMPMRKEAKNLIGYLPEERGLYKKNKLINVITYFGALKGLSAREVREAALPMLEHFSLLPYVHRNVEELSKGNQQKVQFIISVLHRPKLLVFDELFSGLDPVNQVLMREALLRLKREQHAIIFSTHQMEQAEQLCDELLMINHGRTVLHGSPASIKTGFGKNALHIDFVGDGEVLRTLPGVRSIHLSQHHAEVELDPDVRTNDAIAAMLPNLEIKSVRRMEPSLHSIFIDIAGGSREDVPAIQPIPADVIQRTGILRDRILRKHLLYAVISFVLTVVFFSRAIASNEIVDIAVTIVLVTAFFWRVAAYLRRKRGLLSQAHTREEQR